jgi:hypothetical protein
LFFHQVVGGKVHCRGFPCGSAWKCSFCVQRSFASFRKLHFEVIPPNPFAEIFSRFDAEHCERTSEARAAAAAAAKLQAAAEEQLDAGKATIAQVEVMADMLLACF